MKLSARKRASMHAFLSVLDFGYDKLVRVLPLLPPLFAGL